jgi:hypothetical protein
MKNRQEAKHEIIRQEVTGGYKRSNNEIETNAGPNISLKDGKEVTLYRQGI